MAPTDERVLVTGGSGFVAGHCILQLLEKGYNVSTTVRSLTRVDGVRDSLKRGGAAEERVNSVEFTAADLSKDEGWDEACKGCTYVLHVASPFPASAPKHEDDLIVPAREGALRVLQGAKGSGTVKRVVMTSRSVPAHDGDSVRHATDSRCQVSLPLDTVVRIIFKRRSRKKTGRTLKIRLLPFQHTRKVRPLQSAQHGTSWRKTLRA